MLENVSKGFAAKNGTVNWVLRNLTFKLPGATRVGILARPGTGKTTLVNLLSGVDMPSSGKIFRGKGAVSWPFPSRTVMTSRLSAKQNIRFLSDLYGRDYERILNFVTHFSGVKKGLDQPFRQMPADAKYKTTICTYLAMDFTHYVIDDDFESGDRPFRQKVNDFIAERHGRISIFAATSNTVLLENHCEIGGVLVDGKVTFYSTISDAVNIYLTSERTLIHAKADQLD